MAAIIAQLSRANRERRRNAKKTLPPDKSAAFLPPFERRFVPEVHNKYLRCQRLLKEKKRQEKIAYVQDIIESASENLLDDRLEQLKKSLAKRKGFPDSHDNPAISLVKALGGCVFLGVFIVTFTFLFFMFYGLHAGEEGATTTE